LLCRVSKQTKIEKGSCEAWIAVDLEGKTLDSSQENKELPEPFEGYLAAV